eukprot:COSAG01_NODE_7150_length_3329_cov_2.649845_2_plen_111_part_00
MSADLVPVGGIDYQRSHMAQVGYTPDAWIVRNSWTPQWGTGGYIMLERGATNATQSCAADNTPADGVGCTTGPHKTPATTTVCGTCGILFDVSYPTGVKYVQRHAGKWVN